MMTGIETANTYSVLGARQGRGLQEFIAQEESSCCCRNFCKSGRSWAMDVNSKDNGRLAIHIIRPYRYFFHEIQVLDAFDRVLGYVKRKCSICSRQYVLHSPDGTPQLLISSPCFSPWTFHIYDYDNTREPIGQISKKWSGMMQELMTDADNFAATFPPSLPNEAKATILGAVFLIDFMYFEDNEPVNARGGRNRRSMVW